jgi:Mrp family chromosome partitioning ATPase
MRWPSFLQRDATVALDPLGRLPTVKPKAKPSNRSAVFKPDEASAQDRRADRSRVESRPRATDGTRVLIQEIEAEINKVAPGFINLTKAVRHFAGRHLSGETPHETVLGVVSPGSSEGRTTLSLAVAGAMAEMYNRVVLVELETDATSPTLCSEMKLGAEYGLQDYFEHQATLGATLWPTKKEGLWFLPAGPVQTTSNRLDTTTRTKKLFDELSQMFDIVVVDLPPLLTSEEAPPLLSGLTGIVLVASAGSTTTDQIAQTLELCQTIPVKGVLLNKVRLRTPGWLASLLRV